MFMSNRRFSKLFIYLHYALSFISDHVTFNSSVPIEKLNKLFYAKNRIKFIPNGIEIDKKSIKKSSDEKLRLVIVARLNIIKNHMFLLEAINNYPNKSNIVLNIVGHGKEYDTLAEYVKKNSMKNIVFHGEIKNPRSIVEKSDIGVLVSKSEGFSNVILEYMLCAKAIIATDVGSNKLCVTDNGFLIDTINEFHSALDKYVLDKEFLYVHQKNSFKNIDLFDIKNITTKYEELYDEV